MIKIETFQDQSADFTQTLELDGILVELRLIWNIRSEYWIMNTYREINEDNYRYGVKLTKEFPLLFALKSGLILPGDFMVIKTDESIVDTITYDNLSSGWDLNYLTASEISTWKTDNGV